MFFFLTSPPACRTSVPRPGVEPMPPAVEAQSQPLDSQGGPERCFFMATTSCLFSPHDPIQYLFLQCPLEYHLLLCPDLYKQRYSIPLNSHSIFSIPLLHDLKVSILLYFLVILSILYCVCYMPHTRIQLTPGRHDSARGLRSGRGLLTLFANSGHWNLELNTESLPHLDILCIPFILRLLFVHILTTPKLGCCLYHVKRNLPRAGRRVSGDRVIVYPWESLARHIYNK